MSMFPDLNPVAKKKGENGKMNRYGRKEKEF